MEGIVAVILNKKVFLRRHGFLLLTNLFLSCWPFDFACWPSQSPPMRCPIRNSILVCPSPLFSTLYSYIKNSRQLHSKSAEYDHLPYPCPSTSMPPDSWWGWVDQTHFGPLIVGRVCGLSWATHGVDPSWWSCMSRTTWLAVGSVRNDSRHDSCYSERQLIQGLMRNKSQSSNTAQVLDDVHRLEMGRRGPGFQKFQYWTVQYM